MLHPFHLRCTFWNYAAPYKVELHPSELSRSLGDRHPVASGTRMKRSADAEQVGTGIRRLNQVPECSNTGLGCWMPEWRCRRHQPQCRCPSMPFTYTKNTMQVENWRPKVLGQEACKCVILIFFWTWLFCENSLWRIYRIEIAEEKINRKRAKNIKNCFYENPWNVRFRRRPVVSRSVLSVHTLLYFVIYILLFNVIKFLYVCLKL